MIIFGEAHLRPSPMAEIGEPLSGDPGFLPSTQRADSHSALARGFSPPQRQGFFVIFSTVGIRERIHLPQVTAAQELQIKAEARLASLMEEKLVTRISVLSTLLGGGKTTERLFVRISIETHKTSPDFDQAAADKAKNRIKQALGEIGCDVFIETGPLKANDWQVHLSSSHPGAPAFPPFLLQKLCPRARRRTLPWPSHRVRRRLHPPVRLASSSG